MTRRTTLCVIGLAVLVACGPSTPDQTATQANIEAREAAAARERAESAQASETERLRALWTYADVPAGQTQQRSAAIKSSNDVDTGGDLPHSVMLVFRDHPAWGRSSYLILDSGDFRCAPKCTVGLATGDAPPRTLAAHRPDTREAIALFIDDWRSMWRAATGAARLSVTFPVKAGGTRTATFDVAGIDPARMPGWSPRPAP